MASGDINAFAYVLNNPLGFSDPFGLKVVLQTAAVRPPNAEVMSKLEELNRLVPDRDVIITSGSEPRKNPTKDSRHPLGAAADIKIPGLTSAEVCRTRRSDRLYRHQYVLASSRNSYACGRGASRSRVERS